METREVSRYRTVLGGIAFEVPNARFRECPKCGEIAVSGPEIKRWRSALRDHLERIDAIPSSDDIRQLRDEIGCSAADFAAVLGVTRQTVHAWERADQRSLQLGPASLLLSLMLQDIASGRRAIWSRLVGLARERGQQLRDLPTEDATPPSGTGSDRPSAALRQRAAGAPSFGGRQAA